MVNMMIQYEIIPTTELKEEGTTLRPKQMPELIHMDDPATNVMSDFSQFAPFTINKDETMDDALNEMKATGIHVLMVIDNSGHIVGLISSEDLLGAKPIQIIQERRIHRDQVLIKMLMVPLKEIVAFNYEDIESARVGNIVNTMQELKTHYALVVVNDEQTEQQKIRGLFNASQISKLLHKNITATMSSAESLSELQKRHTD